MSSRQGQSDLDPDTRSATARRRAEFSMCPATASADSSSIAASWMTLDL
jgi:hypothetical protein